MEIEEIRKNIDSVDEEILRLFLKRMALSEKVASYKAKHQLPIENSAREEEVLHRISLESGEYSELARELFQCLFSLSKERQRELFPILNCTTEET